MAKSKEDPNESSGITIVAVRIFNFRCLRAVEARLNPITILVGENNAGKTSFLEALHGAIGSGQRQFSDDDIWMNVDEKYAPKERSITVDLRICPTDDGGKVVDTFPEGSPWVELWGNGVQQDDKDRDFVAIRAQYAFSKTKGEYVAERKFLKVWVEKLEDAEKAAFVERIPSLSLSQSAPIALYLLDAKRDGAEDIRVKGSVWHKLMSEPGLKEEDIENIEEKLTEINELFVENSEVLVHVQGHLRCVGDVVNCDHEGVLITSVARRLRDLHKGMDIFIPTVGAPAFPLGRQGMGTRSLASVLLFRAYTSWKMAKRKSGALHPFVAIEEPETHLHPHGQRSLCGQIESIPGQKIISTHSPYICAQADVRSFLHFSKSGIETQINAFDPGVDKPTTEDLRHINRQVLNTRGDLLFSRYLILVEGETEEQAIPLFAKTHWGMHPHELGVSVIGVGSNSAYTPFLRLAVTFNINWVILSDGTDRDIASVNNCLKKVGIDGFPNNTRIFRTPKNLDFEGYMTEPDYIDTVRELLVECAIEEKGLTGLSLEKAREDIFNMTQEDIATRMRGSKTYFGPRLPVAFEKLAPEKQIPPLVREVLDFVRPPNRSSRN